MRFNVIFRMLFTNNKIARAILITVLLLQVGLAGSDPDPAQIILQDIQREYNRKMPFQIEFGLFQNAAHSDRIVESGGVFQVSPKSRFRVLLPQELLLFDGQWLWSWDQTTDEVVVEEFDPRSSLRMIYDLLQGNWENLRVVGMQSTEDGIVEIEMEPADENDFFQSVTLQVRQSGRTIQSARYVDFQESVTEILFEAPRTLPDSGADIFSDEQFNGKEIIDLRF